MPAESNYPLTRSSIQPGIAYYSYPDLTPFSAAPRGFNRSYPSERVFARPSSHSMKYSLSVQPLSDPQGHSSSLSPLPSPTPVVSDSFSQPLSALRASAPAVPSASVSSVPSAASKLYTSSNMIDTTMPTAQSVSRSAPSSTSKSASKPAASATSTHASSSSSSFHSSIFYTDSAIHFVASWCASDSQTTSWKLGQLLSDDVSVRTGQIESVKPAVLQS